MATITSAEFFSAKQTSDTDTVHLTPERANKWHLATIPAVLALPSGTRACAMIVGDSPDRQVLGQRDKHLRQFKIQLVQRKLVIESYRLFGNKRPNFSSDEPIVGRNMFYDFLLKEQDSFKKFISDCWDIQFGTPISVIDIFDLINPKGTLKDANSSAHDIGYNDIWLAILLMKEDDLAVGERWEKLAALVTGNEVVPAWESKKQDIKSSVQEKRDQMQSHPFRKEAEDFEAARTLEQQRKFFSKLERQGLIVMPESLFWWKIFVIFAFIFNALAAALLALLH